MFLQTWAIGIYLFTTGIKGTSSMKLHCDLPVTYKSVWHLAHRLCKAFETDTPEFEGLVEEAFGRIESNKHTSKKTQLGGWTICKVAVVGIKGQDTGTSTCLSHFFGRLRSLARFRRQADGATVYTDDHKAHASYWV